MIQGRRDHDGWIYSDDTPLKYTHWADGEGTSQDSEYITLSVTNYSWYSKDNESEYPYLCEIFPPEYLIVRLLWCHRCHFREDLFSRTQSVWIYSWLHFLLKCFRIKRCETRKFFSWGQKMTFQYIASQRRKCFVKFNIFRPKNIIVFFNSHRTMQYIHDKKNMKNLTPLLYSLLPISSNINFIKSVIQRSQTSP